MTTTTAATPQAAADTPMVVLAGGPLDRRWYWREDLDQLQRSARYFEQIRARYGVSADAVLAYRPTDRVVDNPIGRYGQGQVWTYSPPAHAPTPTPADT